MRSRPAHLIGSRCRTLHKTVPAHRILPRCQHVGWTRRWTSVHEDTRFAGFVAVSDPIKVSTAEAIEQLKKEGIKVVMVTGDNHKTAEAVAKKLGIDFEADVLPEKKAEVVKKLQAAGAIVAMAGDGVNDAPALAQAHVGIAMGTGTDVAMETGGITLIKGDLRGIVKARRLSQHTMSNIRQNLFFAFFYNALGVPLAAGVLYAVTAHRSQGKTVDSVIISADVMKQELFYVSASRGREDIAILTSDVNRLGESLGVSMARPSAIELANEITHSKHQSVDLAPKASIDVPPHQLEISLGHGFELSM